MVVIRHFSSLPPFLHYRDFVITVIGSFVIIFWFNPVFPSDNK